MSRSSPSALICQFLWRRLCRPLQHLVIHKCPAIYSKANFLVKTAKILSKNGPNVLGNEHSVTLPPLGWRRWFFCNPLILLGEKVVYNEVPLQVP
jgi:hypothetical protein